MVYQDFIEGVLIDNFVYGVYDGKSVKIDKTYLFRNPERDTSEPELISFEFEKKTYNKGEMVKVLFKINSNSEILNLYAIPAYVLRGNTTGFTSEFKKEADGYSISFLAPEDVNNECVILDSIHFHNTLGNYAIVDQANSRERFKGKYAFIGGEENLEDYYYYITEKVNTLPVGAKVLVMGNYQRPELEEVEMVVHNGMLFKRIGSRMLTKKPPEANYYAINTANVRSVYESEVIGTVKRGESVTGFLIGDFIFFKFNGIDAKVHKSVLVEQNNKTLWLNANANVRDQAGNVVDFRYKGEMFNASKIGNYYRFEEDGKIRFIWHSFLTQLQQQADVFITNSANVRLLQYDPDLANKPDDIIGTLSRGEMYHHNIDTMAKSIFDL